MSEFVLRLIEIAAWPAVVVFGIVTLRQPLRDLVPSLKKLKYKELELEFEKETSDLLQEIEGSIDVSSPPAPSPGEIHKKHQEEQFHDEPPVMFSRHWPSPEEIVAVEWSGLEKALEAAMLRNGLRIDPFSVTKVAQALVAKDLMGSKEMRAIYKLKAMRNRLVNHSELVSDHAAENFASAARTIQSYVDGIGG